MRTELKFPIIIGGGQQIHAGVSVLGCTVYPLKTAGGRFIKNIVTIEEVEELVELMED